MSSLNNNYKSLGFWAILLPDCILLWLSLVVSIYIRYGNSLNTDQINAHNKSFAIIFAIWILVFFIHGLFEISSFRRYTSLIFNLLSAMVVNFLIAVLYFYLQPNLILTPRRFLFIEVVTAFIFVLVWHLVLKYFISNKFLQGLYIFSFDNELKELEKEIIARPYSGFRVIKHLNEETIASTSFTSQDGIILPDNLNTKPQVLEKFYQLRTLGVKFYNHKDFYEDLLRRVYLSQLNEIWFLENINYQEKRFYNILKRTIDLIFGFIGFIGFLISYPFCALLIKLTSAGPVLFVQERIGKKGEVFKVYKYRTMSGGATNTWTSVNDPRITSFGKFLRKSRIDEWPQFINLLFGTMSLVGPRPEQPHIVNDMKVQIPFYDERHLVKPGLTGWAQLNIYAGTVEESKIKLQYDLYYIKNRSFIFDLEIILKTIYYIFTWQGR